jgi:hypothetical protein
MIFLQADVHNLKSSVLNSNEHSEKIMLHYASHMLHTTDSTGLFEFVDAM